MDMTELHNMLKTGPVQLSFVKRDGTIRTMRATLDHSLFSYEYRGSDAKRNDGVTVLWDLDKGEWRSMRNDSLISYAQA